MVDVKTFKDENVSCSSVSLLNKFRNIEHNSIGYIFIYFYFYLEDTYCLNFVSKKKVPFLQASTKMSVGFFTKDKSVRSVKQIYALQIVDITV